MGPMGIWEGIWGDMGVGGILGWGGGDIGVLMGIIDHRDVNIPGSNPDENHQTWGGGDIGGDMGVFWGIFLYIFLYISQQLTSKASFGLIFNNFEHP